MKTNHKIFFKNSNDMKEIDSNRIDLIITSPPYPMIEMWDSIFSSSNESIKDAFENNEGKKAFQLMHDELDKIWDESFRVLKPGGLICINIGDATRKIGNEFQIFPNHSRIIQHLYKIGFYELPSIIWRKQTNAPNKFMGSGMLPSNAYITLEHEYILIFKKGKKKRKFKPKLVERYRSAYFWEERNHWFSDIWTDLKGTTQLIKKISRKTEKNGLRNRSAAFPFDLPFRLINMFSIYGDNILDPFWGTGTTSLAAMITGRNSYGYELNKNFINLFRDELKKLKNLSSSIIQKRIKNHINFVKNRQNDGKNLKYSSIHYNFKVMTRQEEKILFRKIKNYSEKESSFSIEYSNYNYTDKNKNKNQNQQKDSKNRVIQSKLFG